MHSLDSLRPFERFSGIRDCSNTCTDMDADTHTDTYTREVRALASHSTKDCRLSASGSRPGQLSLRLRALGLSS